MKTILQIHLVALLLGSSTLLSAQSSTGTEFWLGYLENLDLLFNDDPRFILYVEAEQTTTVTVSVPATGFTETFVATANGISEYEFPQAIWYSEGSEFIDNKGIRITSNAPIDVYAFHYRLFFSESTQLLPIEELGTEYFPTCYEDPGNPGTPNSFVVVSTEDNTVVEITPTTLTQGIQPAGIPFTITLDEGQNYQVKASGDLSGTRIRSLSGQPIAVFSGAQQADVEVCSGGADSHIYDQSIPISGWAESYYFVPFSGQGGDPVKIIAAEDNTQIYLDCSELVVLDAGEVFEIKLTQPTIINAPQPISVAQFNSSQSCNASGTGDPNMLQLFPTENQGTDFRWFASNLGTYFSVHYVNVVAPTANTGDILLDGSSQGGFFTPFPANPDWSYAQLQVAAGEHTLNSTTPFHAYSYGFGDFDAYTYNLGYGSTVDLDFACLTIDVDGLFCVDSILQFGTQNNLNIDFYLWDFGGEGASTIANPTFAFDQPGTYLVTLEVILEDGMTLSEELEITIIDCPADPCQNVDTPILSFTGTFCQEAIQFSYQADSVFQNVLWDFGPFGQSTAQSPSVDLQVFGTYTFTFTGFDAFNCPYEAEITVEVPNCGDPCSVAGEVEIVIEGVLCVDSILTITTSPFLDPFSGGGFLFYEFIISTGEIIQFTPEFQFAFSQPGDYVIEFLAFSSGFCDFFGGIEFTIDDDCQFGPCDNLPPISIFTQDDFCANEDMVFSITGAVNFATYSWTTEGASSTDPTLTANYPGPGVYSVQFSGTDVNGCLYEEEIFFDIEDCQIDPCDNLPPISIEFQGTPCVGEDLQFFVTSTNLLVTYEWNLGNGEFPTIFNPMTSYDLPGDYLVTVKAFDLNGCEYNDELLIEITDCQPCTFQAPVAINIVGGGPPCVGEPFSFEVTTDAELVSILWRLNSTEIGNELISDPILYEVPEFNATVTVTLVDTDGCLFEDTIPLEVLECDDCADDLFISVEGDSCIGGAWFLTYSIGTPVISTNWSVDGEPISSASGLNLDVLAEGPVAVSLEVVAIDDCIYTENVQLVGSACSEDQDCPIGFPNIFSPNGDQVNDTFRALYECPPEAYELQIYSRWGGLMFSTTNVDQGWDGTLNGQPCTSDTYAFIAKYVLDGSQTSVTETGSITLIR